MPDEGPATSGGSTATWSRLDDEDVSRTMSAYQLRGRPQLHPRPPGRRPAPVRMLEDELSDLRPRDERRLQRIAAPSSSAPRSPR